MPTGVPGTSGPRKWVVNARGVPATCVGGRLEHVAGDQAALHGGERPPRGVEADGHGTGVAVTSAAAGGRTLMPMAAAAASRLAAASVHRTSSKALRMAG